MFVSAYLTSVPSGSVWHQRVASTTSAVLLLSASAGRVHASIFNHSNASLYVRFGTENPDINNFDVKLSSGSYYELPKPVWTGPVEGVWDSANGFAMVLEMFSDHTGG